MDRIVAILGERGFVNDDTGAMATGPFKVHVRMRPQNLEWQPAGYWKLSISDPGKIIVQIKTRGTRRQQRREVVKIRPSPAKGLIQVRDLSPLHALDVSDLQRSQTFYQDVFAMPMQARQGVTPILGVGSKGQFIALAGGANGSPRKPGINHLCLSMEGFNPDRILKTLASYGIKPRGDLSGPPGPLVSWVSLRKEDRGGSKQGTPELYFTDPDGLTMQLQDVKYCGGSGELGEICKG